MKIEKITIGNFKQLGNSTVTLPSHVVLAGPNNAGKTTLLQAIAAWSLCLQKWRELNNYKQYGGAYYAKAPIARQAFSSVPLQDFSLLWNRRQKKQPIKIDVTGKDWRVPIEIIYVSTEQIYARPCGDAKKEDLERQLPDIIFIPAMTGLTQNEPVYQKAKTDQLLGMGQPGEVLRNLLLQAHQDETVWQKIKEAIKAIFRCELLPPRAGADIYADYEDQDGITLEIASAGAGFLQVLMLLTFLYSRPNSILLLDEPDAHLYVLLQDYVYHELEKAASESGTHLIMATHSEVIINTAHKDNLRIVIDGKVPETTQNAQNINDVMRTLTNTEIVLTKSARGILYVEDYTDRDILLAWAKVLQHPTEKTLQDSLFWNPKVYQHHTNARGIKANQHFRALCAIRSDMRGVQLLDNDNEDIQESEHGPLKRLRWERYEIENYLWHPDALYRFIHQTTGMEQAIQEAKKYCEEQFPPAIISEPLSDNDYLKETKASKNILPQILETAGIHNFNKNRFYEIARVMQRDEIHPEVVEKLDKIAEIIQ